LVTFQRALSFEIMYNNIKFTYLTYKYIIYTWIYHFHAFFWNSEQTTVHLPLAVLQLAVFLNRWWKKFKHYNAHFRHFLLVCTKYAPPPRAHLFFAPTNNTKIVFIFIKANILIYIIMHCTISISSYVPRNLFQNMTNSIPRKINRTWLDFQVLL